MAAAGGKAKKKWYVATVLFVNSDRVEIAAGRPGRLQLDVGTN